MSVELSLLPPVVSAGVQAFVAPVNRVTGVPAAFDAAAMGRFNVLTPPAPWLALGAVRELKRTSETEIVPVMAGAPATVALQTRRTVGATVRFACDAWTKLAMTLVAGTQQMNVPVTGAVGVALTAASTGTSLVMDAGAAAAFAVGSYVAVDVDYAAQTGFVGAGASAAYVSAGTVTDAEYVRRVTLNVGLVTSVAAGVVTLAAPLMAGAPVAGMKALPLAGFLDREGSSFFAEWSVLLVMDGQQGERVLLYYPRMQSAASAAEEAAGGGDGREATTLQAATTLRAIATLRALPVRDVEDGETVVCYRVYLPG